MFPYTTVPKNKSMKATKVPIELIQHFKNTPEIPRRSLKENQNPKNLYVEFPKEQKKDVIAQTKNAGLDKTTVNMTKSKVVQCDISTIANSYVLQGNLLRKHETYEQSLKKQKGKQTGQNKENFQQIPTTDRKQMIKLEYLQKMGFLRPDEKQILAQFRRNYPSQYQEFQKQELPKQDMNQKSNFKYYDLPEKMGQMPSHYSPRAATGADPKKLSQFFSPNGKYLYPSHQFGY